MVGLDAYMYLRYIKICLKLSIFLTFWGLLVLVPVYKSNHASAASPWDYFTIANVLSARWFAAIFGYIFAAYFCQLLLTEYTNFSLQRMQYFVNPNASENDPDTPPQTYYTVMVERVPPKLRSATALKDYFEKLFPGDVYHVEVAMDLSDLNALCKRRHSVRDKLEKEIAKYYASGQRPQAIIPIPIEAPHTWLLPRYTNAAWITTSDLFTLEFYGYQSVDSLNHYIELLMQLNNKVNSLQLEYAEKGKKLDDDIQRQMQEKTDTRAAEMIRVLSVHGKKGLHSLKSSTTDVVFRGGIEGLLFGQKIRPGFNAETLSTLKEQTFAKRDSEENLEEMADQAETEPPDLPGAQTSQYKPLMNDPEDFVTIDVEEREAALKQLRTSTPPPDDDIDGDELLDSLNYERIPLPRSLDDIKTEKYHGIGEPQPNSSPSKISLGSVVGMNNAKTAKLIAKEVAKVGIEQTKLAVKGAIKGVTEAERMLENVTLGAKYKYASTAFVTFKSRLSQSIAYQMLLSHDGMEISPAPNPKDVIWDNVTVPRSQVNSRTFIMEVTTFVLSFLWSSLVTTVNEVSTALNLADSTQQNLAVVVLLIALLILPVIFDFSARYYECMKLESEIQNSIMSRYFYYQLINVYVTVGFGGTNIFAQVLAILQNPQNLVDLLGISIPAVSLFFCNLIIVKIFAAVPLEMLRPWQSITIQIISKCMDRKRSTRRDLRTGVFYAWPMLYGWCYPQLMMVLMIMVTYSCIAPFLMPFCVLFFCFAYIMYKYQLLYVYINDYQSGGYMWYAVFNRSMVSLIFAAITLLGYLSLELSESYYAGPFYFMLPLPFALIYFWIYCDNKFRKASMHLSLDFSKEIDHRNEERKINCRSTPLDSFSPELYRQPSLVETEVFPEAYRRFGDEDVIDFSKSGGSSRNRSETISEALHEIFISPLHAMTNEEAPYPRSTSKSVRSSTRNRSNRSYSINVHELDEDVEETDQQLKDYFLGVVLPLKQDHNPPQNGEDA